MKPTSRLSRSIAAGVVTLIAISAVAQDATDSCAPAKVIPMAGDEPPAKLHVNAPLPEPLAARGVAIIQYCAQNMRLMPLFGTDALAVSPRVGHVHVRLDDAPWVWADASGNPIILMGLPSGPHKVVLELNDANHHPLDKATVEFVVPERAAKQSH